MALAQTDQAMLRRSRPVVLRKAMILCLSATLVAALVGAAWGYLRQHCLPHFREVKHGVLYRSGQPRDQGLELLRLSRIHTIINLRQPGNDGMAEEQAFAGTHGMHFLSLPMGTTYGDIQDLVAKFTSIMDNPENRPVLVHCSRGKERSGILAAVYRMEYEGWSKEDATAEMHSLGLTPGSLPAAEAFIQDFEPRRLRLRHDDAFERPDLPPVRWRE